jgi:hypothetical protein
MNGNCGYYFANRFLVFVEGFDMFWLEAVVCWREDEPVR